MKRSSLKPFAPFVFAAAFGLSAPMAAAQEATVPVAASTQTASVTFGPYVRVEGGFSLSRIDDGFWLPPGAADPQINFNLDADNTGFIGVAVGHDWQNGFRADLSLLRTGTADLAGPCASASDGSACNDHSDITDGSVTTTALMGNLFYAPMERQGSTATFQPFVVAGLGLARNSVGTWTRTANPGNPTPRPVRSFESNASNDLAWSLGVGAAWQMTRPGRWPVIVEASWRYYDFGEAQGGTAPFDPGSTPRQGLTFDTSTQILSIGVRIPLQRL